MRCHALRRALVAAGLLGLASALLLTACRGSPRPDPEAWRRSWQRLRAQVPEASAFTSGDPRPRCEEMLGTLRRMEDTVQPAPSPELDARVQRWLELARSLAYDCPPKDPPYDGFAPALAELAQRAKAVDAQLAYETGASGAAEAPPP